MFYRFFMIFVIFFLGDFPVRGANLHWISIEDEIGDTVFFEGTIVEGDLQKLQQMVNMNHWKEKLVIMFHSPGGNVFEAIKIGRYIRHKKFITIVVDDNICYSACFFSFIGGIFRAIDPKGEIGVHQFSGGQGDADSVQFTTQLLTSDLIDYTETMGVSAQTIKIAGRTLPQEMYVFNESELTRFNIIGDTKEQLTDRVEEAFSVDAGNTEDERVFRQDGWIVKESNSGIASCIMYKRASSVVDGMIWFHVDKDSEIRNMSYVHEPAVLAKFVDKGKKSLKITFDFDGKDFKTLSADYSPADETVKDSVSSFDMVLSQEDTINFSHYNMMSLSIENSLVDMFQLKGIARAFEFLDRCHNTQK